MVTVEKAAVDIERLTQKLSSIPEISAAYLHGSARSGNFRPDSDVDIAILPIRGLYLSLDKIMGLTTILSLDFPWDIDIGLLSTSNVIYSWHAIANGKLLFSHHPSHHDLFVATLMADYEILKQERRSIELAYTA